MNGGVVDGCTSCLDTDGDGAPDVVDVHPCDASVVAAAYSPARGAHASLLYEDQHPLQGDLDFNDLFVSYNYEYLLDASGRVSRFRATFEALAVGGIFTNGFGLHLPVPSGAVASVTRRMGNGSPEVVTPSAADAELTFDVVSNLRTLFGGQPGQINSLATTSAQKGVPVVIDVTLSTPVALGPGTAPHDPFIFRAANRSLEVHRPEFSGTALFDRALLGSGDDRSTSSRSFVDFDGLPFALAFPSLTTYPLEATPISALFPDIVGFAASGGTTNQSF